MKKKQIKKITTALTILLITFVYLLFSSSFSFSWPNQDHSSNNLDSSPVTVSFIDVGQADSILLHLEDKYVLIDAGNTNDGPKLIQYFKNQDIKEFALVIGTHAHEDHIGGMADIINNFKINQFYMPNALTTTKTFENVLDALANKNITFETPTIGSTFTIGNAKFQVIYTGTDTSDLNNTSIVIKMVYQNISFLFTGDATSSTEAKILNQDLKSTFLKVGHHGSEYSSTPSFLEKVNPEVAIISVGANNKYNHPSKTTLSKLDNYHIKTYRTDESGTIIIHTDGIAYNIETIKTDTNGG